MSSEDEDEDDEEDEEEEAIWAEGSYTMRFATQSLSHSLGHSATPLLCHSVTLSLCYSPRYHTTRSNATTTRHHRDSCNG